MARRPAQGRGSGGRVTPSPRASASGRAAKDAPGEPARARARVLRGRGPDPAASGGPPRRPRGRRTRSRRRIPHRRCSGASSTPGRTGPARPGRRPSGSARGGGSATCSCGSSSPSWPGRSCSTSSPRWRATPSTAPRAPASRLGELVGRLGAGQPPAVTRTWADMPLWLSQGVLNLPLWTVFIGGSIYATVHKGFGPRRDLKLDVRPRRHPAGPGHRRLRPAGSTRCCTGFCLRVHRRAGRHRRSPGASPTGRRRRRWCCWCS